MDAGFGLADARIVEALRILWPSGTVEELKEVKVNQIVVVKEGQGIIDRIVTEHVARKQSIFSVLLQTISDEGVEAAVTQYHSLKDNNFDEYDFSEGQLNYLGYRMLQEGKIREAIAVFRLNIEAYPQSANAHDSMAEAYLQSGNTEQAKKFYKEVLRILSDDPQVGEETRETLTNNALYALKNMK
jgi:tetratricopeptide (TPR) repeat protein